MILVLHLHPQPCFLWLPLRSERPYGSVSALSGQNFFDHFSMNVSQTVVTALESMNQTLMIKS